MVAAAMATAVRYLAVILRNAGGNYRRVEAGQHSDSKRVQKDNLRGAVQAPQHVVEQREDAQLARQRKLVREKRRVVGVVVGGGDVVAADGSVHISGAWVDHLVLVSRAIGSSDGPMQNMEGMG